MDPLLIGAGVLALVAYFKSKGSAVPPEQESKPVSSDTGLAGDSELAVKDGLAIVGAGVGIVGAAGSVATAAGTSLGSIASGVGTTAVQVASAGLLTFPPFWFAVIIIAATIVGNKLTSAKGFVKSMENLLPDARRMVFYESSRIEDVMGLNGMIYSKTVVQDPRMERTVTSDGQQIRFIGERPVYSRYIQPLVSGAGNSTAINFNFKGASYINAFEDTIERGKEADFLSMQKACRALGLVYTFELAKYASAYLRNWAPKIAYKEGFQLPSEDFYLNHLYDDLPLYEGEKLGGLNQIPLVGGYTEKQRVDPNQLHPEAGQLRGVNTTPSTAEAVKRWAWEAKFVAFKHAIQIIQFDTAVYFPWDPVRYAKDVYNRLELTGDKFALQGSTLILKYTGWGFTDSNNAPINICVDIIDIKDNGPLANWYNTKA